MNPEQFRRIREKEGEKIERAQRPLFEFLEEKVRRCRELEAKVLAEEALSESEQAELDLLRRMEITRFTILCLRRFGGHANKQDFLEWWAISRRHFAAREFMIEQVRSGRKLNVQEQSELQYVDKIELLVRKAGAFVGRMYYTSGMRTYRSLEYLLGPASKYSV